ncbi:hypothetical protein FBU30_007381 [Linnemannia zychae]|nr:hypothetical protein FBU30_007381 [Linnemannia zychae]
MDNPNPTLGQEGIKPDPTPGQKTAFIVLGVLLFSIGLVTTYLFQRISKKDNNLRQRGRYLVTIQGYSETIFLAFMLSNGAFPNDLPCFVIFQASYLFLVPFVLALTGRAWRLIARIERNQDIYQSRFADPSDLAELTKKQSRENGHLKNKTLVPTQGFSSSRLNSSFVNLTSTKSNSQQPTYARSRHDPLDQYDRVFELTQKSQQEIAHSNKWYNRYKKATDRHMFITGIAYMALCVAMDIGFQATNTTMKNITPPYRCQKDAIVPLNGVNDGYGIRKELIWISLLSLPCIAIFFTLPKVAEEFTVKYVDRLYFMAIILVAAHVPSIIMPLIRHYRANPHVCGYRNKPDPEKLKEGTRSKRDKDQDHGKAVATNSEHFTLSDEQMQAPARQPWFNSSNDHFSFPTGTNFNQQGARDHHPHIVHPNQTENSVLNLKNLIRSQQRSRFGFGMSEETETIRYIKTDWDVFIKALEDRRMFDHFSVFTVAEFCAENTRFLYEVARLEKRATQYERLRDLTSASQDVIEPIGNGVTSSLDRPDENIEKGSTNGTRDSTLGPLPTQFASAHQLQLDGGKGSQRIKKIVSVASVSSTMPMLGSHRSSSSLIDESEPSSPLGSSSYSTFRRYGGSSVALPDLEEAIAENQEAGNPSMPIHLDIINIPNTPFATLPMPPTLLIQFEYVYNTFIAPGARLELNLSHETAHEIHNKAKKAEWTSGMFDGATFEVQELLFRDVWPKYVSSSRGLQAFESEEEYEPSDKFGVTGAGSRTTLFLPFDHHQLSRQPTNPSPAHSIKSPKSSLSKATSTRSTSSPSTEENSMGTKNVDTFTEEPSRTGFKVWLDKKNRSGITAATLISREGDTEESLGIMEQSRRSMIARRSDTSGLYSSTLAPPS